MAPDVERLPEFDPEVIPPMPVGAAEQEVVVLLGADGELTASVIVPGIVSGGASPTAGGIGLTPPLASSVAPSGIAPPLRWNCKVAPAAASGEAEPSEEVSSGDEQLDIEAADPTPPSPPPSKEEVALVVVPEALIPFPAELDARGLQLGFGAGLNPPGLISVAANGMPVPLDPPEPNTPGGEVAPIAERLIELCAKLEAQLIGITRIAAAITRNRRIDTSVGCLG
jgi:hypothetical protein